MRYRERRRRGITGMRVAVAEEGSGHQLAAKNHSCLDPFATGLGLPLHSTSRLELQLRAGASLSVPTVKSGVPPCHVKEGIPSHIRQGVTCRRRGSCFPRARLRTTLQALCSSFQPSGWTSVLHRCRGRLGDLNQHLVLWLIAGPGCFALFTKRSLVCRLKIILSLSLLTSKSPTRGYFLIRPLAWLLFTHSVQVPPDFFESLLVMASPAPASHPLKQLQSRGRVRVKMPSCPKDVL